MKRKNLKSGDAIPIDDKLFFVVVKPFEMQKDSHYDDDYSYYNVDDVIVINDNERCAKSFLDFLEHNCQLVVGEGRMLLYTKKYSNACVGDVYEGGSYKKRFFYIVEKEQQRILENLNLRVDDCYWALESHIQNMIGELCDVSNTMDISVGLCGEVLFIYNDYDDDGFLNICRKATPEEVQLLNSYVEKKHKEYRERFAEERRRREEARIRCYEENKNNPEMYPGVAGNYKQTLYIKGAKAVPEKEYSLGQIKEFFETLLNCNISEELKKNMIFYGGTIPYLMCDEKQEVRKFGDVDIFLPVWWMDRLRIELGPYIKYVYDSMTLTKVAKLTVKGKKVQAPWLDWDEEVESYNEFNARLREAERRAEEKSKYQDYGFKAVLFGINISVFPLYDWTFDDGTIGVCAKSFKIGKEEGAWKFLLNTVVSKGITISDFYDEVLICGHVIHVAKPEYTIASKKNAIRFGYLLRRETDEADLKYIIEHSDILGIDEEKVRFFMDNIPDYGVSHVFRISRSFDVSTWTPEQYKYVAMSSDKPS